MADKKISALTASATPLAGTEVLPIVQSGSTVQVSVANLTAGRAVSASSLTASTANVIIGTTTKGVTTGSAIPLGLGVNNTVTAITIDTSSNVGVGTTSPQTKFHVFDGVATITSAVNTADTFANRTDSIVLTRNNLSPNWKNKITSSWSGNNFDTSMNFELAITGSTSATVMTLLANGNVLIGTSTANATALLDVQSKTKGVRFPNMTTTEKNAITPLAGTVVFDTTLAKLCVYSGSAWQTITST